MMSLEDNEKLKWGEAAVRVPTCKVKGHEAEGSWDEGGLMRPSNKKGLLKGVSMTVCKVFTQTLM